MRIGVIQASSQKDKNEVLYRCTCQAVKNNGREDTVINFGRFPDEKISFSYVETALNISLLLSSGAVDFIVTGCSHAGICNITRYAKQVTGCSRVLGVIGGFHLFDEDAEQTAQTAVFFKREGLTQFYPCHCTSLLAKLRLAEELLLREVGVGLQLCWDDADGTLREVRGMTE